MPHGFISLATSTTSTNYRFWKISYKAQKSPYLPKKREKDAKTHGSSSWHIISFSAHESHQGNFGSRGLKGQEICSVKL